MHICKIINTHLVFTHAQQVNHFKITRCNKVLLHQHKKFIVALISAPSRHARPPRGQNSHKGRARSATGTDQCNIKSYVI